MKQIYRPIKVRKKELPLIYTYGILALFAGLFLSSFDILVHAKFLEVFGYKYLSSSYIAAGSIGVVISYLYSRIFRKVHTKSLNSELTTLIIVAVGSYLLVSIISPSKANSYIGMVLLFPVNILISLTLWRFSRKMLSANQSKEITPKIRISHFSGLAIGGTITSLSLELFNSFLFITIFCIIIILLYGVCQFILFKIHSQSNLFHSGKENYIPTSDSLFLFFTSRIAANLYLFALLSAIVGFSIHFTFINIATAGFQNVIGLSKFYGLFISVLIIFIFGVDKYLIRKILYSYDSPYSLVLIPFIIITVILITISGFHFLSKSRPHEHFTMFFLLLAITKVGVESTRTIIQIPSMRVLFQTMDIRYRQVIYPRIEGTSVMLGLLISGLVILPISFLKSFTLNYVIYWTAAVSIAWLVVAIKLIKLYKDEQTKTLEQLRYNKAINLASEMSYKERLWTTLTGNDINKIIRLLDILSIIKPLVYEDYLERLLAHHNEEVKELIIKRIKDQKIYSLIPKLLKRAESDHETENKLFLQVVSDLKRIAFKNKSFEQLRDILFSGDSKERLKLANSLTNKNTIEAEDILFELIKDIEPEVKEAALKSLAQIQKPRFNYILLDFLYHDNYNPYAMDIIANSGEEAIDHLEREQNLANTPDIVLVRTIKLMGRIGSERAISNIIANITNQDKYVQFQSIQTLIDNQFQASKKNRYKLLNLVVKQIGIITQNVNYYRYLYRKPKFSQLSEAYRQEIDFNYDLLFKLLSIIYNPYIIASLKDIFFEGGHSQVNHGIEIADQYIDEDIKHVLFPLLEDININNRLKRLEHYFIQPKIKSTEIIRTSLTQDYKTLSFYPRACAMMHVYNYNINTYEEELVFNVYHKELILSQTAIFVLLEKYPSAIRSILNEEQNDKKLEQQIINTENLKEEDLLFSRLTNLKKHIAFKNLPEHIALKLALRARKITLHKNEPFLISELNSRNDLLLSNSPILKGDNNCVISCFENFVDIDLLISYGITKLIPDCNAEFWLFSGEIVKELLFDHVSFTDSYLSVIENTYVSAD